MDDVDETSGREGVDCIPCFSIAPCPGGWSGRRAHSCLTYFLSIHLRLPVSSFSSGLLRPSGRLYRYSELAAKLPRIPAISSAVHLSRVSDLTLEMCRPRLRCIPEHLIQTKVPWLKHAHLTEREVQSAHSLLPCCLAMAKSLALFASDCWSYCIPVF